MIYNRSLQGRFVSGKYTPLILLFLSVVVWGIGLFCLPMPASTLWPMHMFCVPGGLLAVVVPLLCYVAMALILGMLHLHERRISWFTSLYFFLISVSVSIHCDIVCAVAAVLFMTAMTALLSCHPGEGAEGGLFTAYALLGFMSCLLPQFLFLLPLFVVYLFVANVFGIRRFLAAMLGLLMPFWFLFGIIYIWPRVAAVVPASDVLLQCLAFFDVVQFTPLKILLLVTELAIMLPAMTMFVGSSVPSKPFLRRRLLFIMITNSYLLVLSIVSAPNFEMLYAWRVPGIAVLASYLFSQKVTKLSSIYFLIISIMWLAVAVFGIWVN